MLERLVEEYAPDCIVLNEVFDAIHIYGSVAPYVKGVKSGRVSNNIKDIIVDELSVAISTALYRCEKNEEDVFYKDVLVTNTEEEQQFIDLSIFYIKNNDLLSSPRYYIVQFISNTEDGLIKKAEPKITFDASEQSRQRIRDLEQELTKKQEHLQVTIEELETTNEELQSANEELMSANEELQSTNEELQSVNEELYTVNSEYQEKITELTEASNDLDSVIEATDIGIIFLDDKLTIRKFTPPASSYVHVRGADIGRPFHHISHELVYDDFLTDIASVSSSGSLLEKDVITSQGQTLLVHIRPYKRSSEVSQAGIIITLTNISRQKFVESALKKAQEQVRSALLDNEERLHKRVVSNTELKVLLLDDDSLDRKRISRMLDSAVGRDFNVTAFSEIDEAVSAATKNSYDIYLIDYNLSGGTARDFVEQVVKAQGSEQHSPPVVILSGYSEAGLDMAFLENDIADFLNKEELSMQLLTRSIDYVLERRDVRAVFESMDTA